MREASGCAHSADFLRNRDEMTGRYEDNGMKLNVKRHPALLLVAIVCLCLAAGCYTNRVHGVLPRTGELFMSTRAPLKENNGVPIMWTGVYYSPTIIAPVVCVPAGFVVGILDQCVFSPVWDVLCIPADLLMPVAKMRTVNTAGELVKDSYVYCAGKHEANNDGVIQFKLMRILGNPASVTVNAPGYASYTYSVPRDGKEHTYVLMNKEELWAKLREDESRRREEEKRRFEDNEVEFAKKTGDMQRYWGLVLSGPLERLKKAKFHYGNMKSEDFKTETSMLFRFKYRLPEENLNYLFSLVEQHPELANEWCFLYGVRNIQAGKLESNRAFALKLAEEKKTIRPLLVVINRGDTPDEYKRVAMNNPNLAYCRNAIEKRLGKLQK